MLKKIKYVGQKVLFWRNRNKTNEEVFSKIYAKHLWNEGDRCKKEPYYSGRGSDDVYGNAYAKVILKFMEENGMGGGTWKVVDLGCGDFRVAAKFAGKCKKYIGIDCVSALVKHHNNKFANDRIHFFCLDITKDKLPKAQLCLIRQVLQHLSNAEIQKVLDNCRQYPYIIVTEHLLNSVCPIPNIDKTRGMHTRLFFGSGVYLEQKPFYQRVEKLCEIPYDNKSHLEILLIKNTTSKVV